jgi:hypothetical protein
MYRVLWRTLNFIAPCHTDMLLSQSPPHEVLEGEMEVSAGHGFARKSFCLCAEGFMRVFSAHDVGICRASLATAPLSVC